MVTKTQTNISNQTDLEGGRPSNRRGMKLGGESREEATQRNLLTSKSTIKLGTWNVRTMYTPGKADNIAREMRAYKLKLLGLAETRWIQAGETKLTSGERILYSGHQEDQAHHTEGVALMLSKEAQKALLGWEPVNSRIMSAKFRTSNNRIGLNIIQCYAPTNDAEESKKEEFYERLETIIRKQSNKDVTILMGDMNAKVGKDNGGYQLVMGNHGMGRRNENGGLFADCCAEHNLVIGGTIFPHKPKHQATWTSPDMNTENQIDHICITRKFRRSLQDVRVRRGADAATDHHLVVAKLKLKLLRCKVQTPTSTRYNVALLADTNKQAEYQIELTNRYRVLQNDSEDINDSWQHMKEAWQVACKVVVGTKKGSQQEWITPETVQ
jgi:exonuclease III